jgi:hypothetical protein
LWIDDRDDGKTLWSLQELAKRVGVTPKFALKRLPQPVATLMNANRCVYLYREIFWVALKKDIMSGKLRVPLRSIKGRKSGVYFADPYHPLASDQPAEQQRIAKLRKEPASWARMY